MAGSVGNIVSSAVQSVLDKIAGMATDKAGDIKQNIEDLQLQFKNEPQHQIPTIKPVVPKLSSIDIDGSKDKDDGEEMPSVFEASGRDVESVPEESKSDLKATIDTVGSTAARFFQHPIDTLLGMDTPEWEAEQKAKQEQSRGKSRGSFADDPEREQYLDEYQSLFVNDPEYDPAGKSAAQLMRESYLDDGIDNNYDSLTSNTMTGEQYLRYVNAGIPGRAADDIDPNATYSKMDEYQNFGFIPYAPDEDAVRGMQLQQSEAGPAKFFNELANSRTNLNPYTVTVGDKTFNGNEFDEVANPYLRKQQELIDAQDPSLFDPNADHTGMTAMTPSQYHLKLSSGEEFDVPGGGFEYVTKPEGYYDENGEIVYTNPGFVVQFRNGEQIQFDSPEDFQQTVTQTGWRAAGDGDAVSMWVPDLTLGDGTTLSYADVVNVATDEKPNDTSDGVSYDFGTLNLGRPQRFNEGIIAGGLENLPANFWDIAASSAPYFWWPTSIAKAGSDASSALSGVQPMTINPDGSGTLAAEDLDDDRYLSNIAFNAAMPLTEKIAGGVGGRQLINLNPLIEKRFGGHAIEPLLKFGGGVAGEGAEEVAGNIFEELADNGFMGWYANDMVNDAGKPVYDDTGHVVKDESTSIPERLINYLKDAPDAFVGGALLGGAMGVPRLMTRDIPEMNRRREANAEAKAAGLNPFRNVDGDDVEFVLPDSLRMMYEGER